MMMAVIVFGIPAIIFSIVCHEVAHGYAAHIFGDDTAKNQGRLSLNPMAHIHWFGSVVLPALCIIFGLPIFAMAKPVPINFEMIFNNKRAMFCVAIAGVVVNLALALIFGGIFRMLGGFGSQGAFSAVLVIFSVFMVQINVVLMVFNLLPIPPLDGSRILTMWLSWDKAIWLESKAMFFIMLILFLFPHLPIIKAVMSLTSFILGSSLQ